MVEDLVLPVEDLVRLDRAGKAGDISSGPVDDWLAGWGLKPRLEVDLTRDLPDLGLIRLGLACLGLACLGLACLGLACLGLACLGLACLELACLGDGLFG